MSKDKKFQLVVSSNGYVAAASLIYSHGYNIADYYKQDIFKNP